jgi:uncharacterized protein YutE (UPF0331/DUF86 family)
MTPSLISSKIVSDRIEWVRGMNRGIRSLPLSSYEEFAADPRNVASAESYLRRGIEAMFDLCRHLLAKGFGIGTLEYKEIAGEMSRLGIFAANEGQLLRDIAGYRNRMVHFYHEISAKELYRICSDQLDDLEHLLDTVVKWIRSHPDKIDDRL